eukprot:37390_1
MMASDKDSIYSFQEKELIICSHVNEATFSRFNPCGYIGVIHKIDYQNKNIIAFTIEFISQNQNTIETICKRVLNLQTHKIITLKKMKMDKNQFIINNLNKFQCNDDTKYNKLITINETYDPKTMIYRISGDYKVQCELSTTILQFPVYCCDLIIINKKHSKTNTNKNTKKTHKSIKKTTQNNIINIDPYLFMAKLNKNAFIHKLKTNAKHFYDIYSDQKVNYNNVFIRGNYQWISTIFSENENNISITSPIHNLQPRSKHKKSYKSIECIFTAMLPLFNKFDQFKNRENKKEFKVIIDLKMKIKDLSELNIEKYYHIIGLTENILLCGIYVIAGNGDFKIKFMGSANYACGYRYAFGEEYVEYKLIKNHAIVFENLKCIHKFKQKRNSNSTLSFILFYVINPCQQNECISTKDIPCLNKDIYLQTITNVFETKYTHITKDIIYLIIDYAFFGILMTYNEANKIKDNIIESEIRNRGKWAFNYQHNNDGGWNCFFPIPTYFPWISFDIYQKCLQDKLCGARRLVLPLDIKDVYHIVEPSDNEVDHYQKLVKKLHFLE